MPVISRIKRKARKVHRCDNCGKVIKPGEIYSRLYGYAEHGDPKYAIKLHPDCDNGGK